MVLPEKRRRSSERDTKGQKEEPAKVAALICVYWLILTVYVSRVYLRHLRTATHPKMRVARPERGVVTKMQIAVAAVVDASHCNLMTAVRTVRTAPSVPRSSNLSLTKFLPARTRRKCQQEAEQI